MVDIDLLQHAMERERTNAIRKITNIRVVMHGLLHVKLYAFPLRSRKYNGKPVRKIVEMRGKKQEEQRGEQSLRTSLNWTFCVSSEDDKKLELEAEEEEDDDEDGGGGEIIAANCDN